jgi:hypothetical protein
MTRHDKAEGRIRYYIWEKEVPLNSHGLAVTVMCPACYRSVLQGRIANVRVSPSLHPIGVVIPRNINH